MTLLLMGLALIIFTWPIAYYLFQRIVYELKIDTHVIGKRVSRLYILVIQLMIIIAILLILVLILNIDT
ncbi:hypothetical protein CIRMBP1248_01854 [Enterococcus cecorum]|nr:hypothetical protein CIRMBP1256_01615 [Enterococcus cecorum]CAI3424069.1 hypothetical protein CIRMBP1248_01854 [Enterococcus cecorum]